MKHSSSRIPSLNLHDDTQIAEIIVEKQNFLDFESAVQGPVESRWLPLQVIRRTPYSRDSDRKNRMKGDQTWNNQETEFHGKLDLSGIQARLEEIRERRKPKQIDITDSKPVGDHSSQKQNSGSTRRSAEQHSSLNDSETERWRRLVFRVPLILENGDSEQNGSQDEDLGKMYLKLKIRLDNFDVGPKNLYSSLRISKLLSTIKPVERFPEKNSQLRLIEFFEELMPNFSEQLNYFCEKENYQLDIDGTFSTKGITSNGLALTVSSSMLIDRKATDQEKNACFLFGNSPRRESEAKKHIRKSLFCHQIVQKNQVLDLLFQKLR